MWLHAHIFYNWLDSLLRLLSRYGLQLGSDTEEEAEVEQPAAERLATDLQDMSLSGSDTPSFRVFRWLHTSKLN